MFDNKGHVRTVLVSKRDVTMEKEYQAKYYQAENRITSYNVCYTKLLRIL